MAREIRLQLDAEKLLDQLVGKVRGYYRNGIFYEHDDGIASINGANLLEYIFQELPLAELDRVTYRGGKNIAVVDLDVKAVWSFMSASGSRAMDYTEEDAVDDIMSNSIGILASAAREYRVKVNPYDYAVKSEDYDESRSGTKNNAFKVMEAALWEDPDLYEAQWSTAVTKAAKYHPPEGTFKKGATAIAKQLAGDADSLKQAMSRLNFYINRAGSNLSAERKKTLDQAKKKLRDIMGGGK